MDATGQADLKKVFRTLLWILVIWAIINHTIRFAARHVGGGGLGGYAVSATLGSLDRVRMKIGDKVQGIQTWCPESVEQYCHDTVDAMRILLGLHR